MIAARPLLDRFVGLMQVTNAFYRSNPANLPKRMDISQEDVQQLFRSLNALQVRYLLTDLITEKRATGRPKDLSDVDELRKLMSRGSPS